MKVSEQGIKFIKSHESLSLTPYKCPTGVPTIGYGCTYYPNGARVLMSDPPITLEYANELFTHILEDFEFGVESAVRVPLEQLQFDALVSLAFNIGLGSTQKPSKLGFRTSTLLRHLNAGRYISAASEFNKWVYSNGVKLSGLEKRRRAEREMFLAATSRNSNKEVL